MVVDANEKNEMARLIALMNQGVVLEDSSAPTMPKTNIIEGRFDSSGDPSIEAMKNILRAFNGSSSLSTSPDKRLTERSNYDRELREALITESTERGTRVGSWEILITENHGLKQFDVINVHTGEPIATDLTVYDAALGITRRLNEGQTINSKAIRDILNAEASYDSNRQDAATFRARVNESVRSGNDSRADIMEARFTEAVSKAKLARVKLGKLAK